MSRQKPQIIGVDADQPSAEALEPAAQALRSGRLVAFPTETVYGLGANALDEAAVGRIFAAKARPATNPLIVHIADLAEVDEIVADWPALATKLADAFWPGPLTLVLPRRAGVPASVTASLDTVAVRMPAHPVALELIRQAGVPVAAPSANRYTEVSPTRAEHVLDSLGEAVDIIVDAGPTKVGVESTVLSLVGERPEILRAGMVTCEDIAKVAPRVVYAGPIQPDEQASRPSPGLARKHYAPRADLRVIDDIDTLLALVGAAESAAWVVVELFEGTGPRGPVVVMGDDPDAYAEKLYDVLRDLDKRGVDTILVEQPPQGGRWRAIHDRLSRAAT
ncbi:MAG: L-threonylcarbamoyladenylate synthase [Persicimonas sp.]